MAKIFAWIIQAAKDIYSLAYNEIGAILKVLKDKTGKYSWKRVTGAVAFIYALYIFMHGGVIAGIILLGYALFVVVFSAITGS